MNELLITIAIPTYNNEKTIQNAVASCLNQDTEENYEILIVNNASNDNTGSIIKQYEASEKVKIVTNDQTVSLFENHNVCLKNAGGKYLLFCHSDDTLENHAIEILADKIKQRSFPEKYIIWGHSMFRDFSRSVKNAEFSLNEMIVGEFAPLLFLPGGLTPSGTCYSRDSLVKMGGFLKTSHRLAPSDMTTMLYCAINGFRFEMIDEMIFNRTYATTATNLSDTDNLLDSIDDAFIEFVRVTDTDNIDKILAITLRTRIMPFNFYYPLAKDSSYKKRIAKMILIRLILHPSDIRHYEVLYKLIKRLMIK